MIGERKFGDLLIGPESYSGGDYQERLRFERLHHLKGVWQFIAGFDIDELQTDLKCWCRSCVATRGRTVEIARGSGGSFSVGAHVNGARVPMVLDTGASAVVLTQEAAKAAGLPLEVLNYSVNVDTANGRARAAPVTLDRLSIGDITERSVPALVAQGGQLRTSLLGMSFLNRLESWEVRGDKLMLRGYP